MSKLKIKDQIVELQSQIKQLQDVVLVLANKLALLEQKNEH